MKFALLAVKNYFDFFLRNQIHLSREIPDNTPMPERDLKLQSELREFLELLPWKKILEAQPSEPLVVTDIGSRNFVLGPVLDKIFEKNNRQALIHGIEVDGHRVLWGFHSRADYGNFYAKKMRSGYFHAMDFFDWNQTTDIAFLLNPFVSKEPLLSWGLPLSQLQPEKLFQHVRKTLRPETGILILTCPSLEELEIARKHAKTAGFIKGTEVLWKPGKNSVQQKPRYGVVYPS
jgi:hypothetical protein